MKNILALTLVSTLILGCSSTGMTLDEKDTAFSKYVAEENFSSKEKVTGFKFRSWKALSDNYLIITAIHNKDILIETQGKCYGLKNSRHIQLNLFSKRSIYRLGDSISPVGSVTDKCLIKSIYPITNIQADYLIKIGKPVDIES
ncbi:MAG: hypothetical protein HRT53_06810 [Colwellia sp.]|nr:hypothetical protein [Colwellia sp.]